MLLLEQLELRFGVVAEPDSFPFSGLRRNGTASATVGRVRRDLELECYSASLLAAAGATRIAHRVQVRWSSRLTTAAGRADSRAWVITLNPRLLDYGEDEIDRTLRHELAHLLAQHRAGRRRISPHGREWRTACADLGIANESRCH